MGALLLLRNIRMPFPDATDKSYTVVRHIRHTVYHIHCRIHFGQQFEETFVQLSVARKAQINDRHIQLALQDIGPGHTGTRSTCPLRNGSSVYHDRLFDRRTHEIEAAAFGHTNL